jgi:hypothetical protein
MQTTNAAQMRRLSFLVSDFYKPDKKTSAKHAKRIRQDREGFLLQRFSFAPLA